MWHKFVNPVEKKTHKGMLPLVVDYSTFGGILYSLQKKTLSLFPLTLEKRTVGAFCNQSCLSEMLISCKLKFCPCTE